MSQHKPKPIIDKSRRRFLIGASVTAGIFAAGLWGVKQRQTPDYTHPAYGAWEHDTQGDLSDLDYMILCAGLAPSPHNTQPWQFEADSSAINVFALKERHLGRADPDLRQMQIALGCSIYNASQAARYLGYEPKVVFDSDERFDQDGRVARIRLSHTGRGISDSEFAAIFQRSTNRGQYDLSIRPPEDMLAANVSEWEGVRVEIHAHDSELGRHVRRSVRVGARNCLQDSESFEDSVKWWRFSRDELVQKQDGVSIHTSEIPFFVKEGIERLVEEESWKGDYGRNGELDWVDRISAATTAWGVIYAEDDSQSNRVASGMMLEKSYLLAAQHGMSIHPLIYSVEDPESHDRLTMALPDVQGKQVMAVFRLGKGVPLEKTVRRQLEAIKV